MISVPRQVTQRRRAPRWWNWSSSVEVILYFLEKRNEFEIQIDKTKFSSAVKVKSREEI